MLWVENLECLNIPHNWGFFAKRTKIYKFAFLETLHYHFFLLGIYKENILSSTLNSSKNLECKYVNFPHDRCCFNTWQINFVMKCNKNKTIKLRNINALGNSIAWYHLYAMWFSIKYIFTGWNPGEPRGLLAMQT